MLPPAPYQAWAVHIVQGRENQSSYSWTILEGSFRVYSLTVCSKCERLCVFNESASVSQTLGPSLCAMASSSPSGALDCEDWAWLQRVQAWIERNREYAPRNLEDALSPLRLLLTPEENQHLDATLRIFKKKLERNFLGRRHKIACNDHREVVEGLEAYNPEYACAIFVYTLDRPSIYKLVNGEASSKERGSHSIGGSTRINIVLPFILFLQEALEALPESLVLRDGQVLCCWIHNFKIPGADEVVDRFPIHKHFYHFAFPSSTRCQYHELASSFLHPHESGVIFEINITPEAPAYDIDLFSYFTHEDPPEGFGWREVLFGFLSLWAVRDHVRKGMLLEIGDGEQYSVDIIPVESVKAPRCEACARKVYPRHQREFWLSESSCCHDKVEMGLSLGDLPRWLYKDEAELCTADLQEFASQLNDTKLRHVRRLQLDLPVELEATFPDVALQSFEAQLQDHDPPKMVTFRFVRGSAQVSNVCEARGVVAGSQKERE